MKSLIIVVFFVVSLAFAQEDLPKEAPWKTSLRTLIARFSPQLSERLLGKPQIEGPAVAMPEIPKAFKKNTDATTYNKLQKKLTAFDRLPPNRKRQFDYNFLQELFVVTRKSDAKDEDLANWLNTLDQGGSREGIYQALVLDDVYATLENMEEKPTEKLVSFCVSFAQKYLQINYKPETLEQYNLYTLKRILTEKGLDLLEYYETKDLDAMDRWYALVSAEMGNQYSPLLKTPLRQDPAVEVHLAWAKDSPVQHIKSEFIIKLHTVMNGLQLLQ